MTALSLNRLVVVALLSACLVWSSTTRAQEPSEVFFPFFVELPGWKGSKPFAHKSRNGLVVTAGRSYLRGDEQVSVSVTVVPNQVNKPVPPSTFETKERRIVYSTIDGWQVASTFDFDNKSSTLIVMFSTNGHLTLLAPKGVANGDLLTLARRFDWKALDAAVQTFASAK